MANATIQMRHSSSLTDATITIKAPEPWRENLNMQMICRDCKEVPPNLVEEFSSGDMVCGSCGLVLGDRIVDTRSEWRTFSNDDQGNDDPSRVGDGANPLLNGSQLQTSISFGDGPNGRNRELHRAQNKATHDKGTKGLLTAYKEVGALCDAIGIPKNVSDTAKHLFKMVHDAGAFKGKSQETIIAGCIFIACRQCKVDRTFREIFALTKVTKAEIGRIFKALEKFFAAQNQQKVKDAEQIGGKSKAERRLFLCSCLLNYMYAKAPSTKRSSSISLLSLQILRSSALAFVISSILAFKLLPSHKKSLRKWIKAACWPAGLLYLSQQRASTQLHTLWDSPRAPRISRRWLVSVMAQFVTLTSLYTPNVRSSLTQNGLSRAKGALSVT